MFVHTRTHRYWNVKNRIGCNRIWTPFVKSVNDASWSQLSLPRWLSYSFKLISIHFLCTFMTKIMTYKGLFVLQHWQILNWLFYSGSQTGFTNTTFTCNLLVIPHNWATPVELLNKFRTVIHISRGLLKITASIMHAKNFWTWPDHSWGRRR